MGRHRYWDVCVYVCLCVLGDGVVRRSGPGGPLGWSGSMRGRERCEWGRQACPLITLSHRHISITFPYGTVTMAMADATYEMPDKTLKVCYWPQDTWPMGLPYVEMSDDKKSC